MLPCHLELCVLVCKGSVKAEAVLIFYSNELEWYHMFSVQVFPQEGTLRRRASQFFIVPRKPREEMGWGTLPRGLKS